VELPETAVNKAGEKKDRHLPFKKPALKCHYLLSTLRPGTSSSHLLYFPFFCLWLSLFGAFSAHGTFAAQPSETLGNSGEEGLYKEPSFQVTLGNVLWRMINAVWPFLNIYIYISSPPKTLGFKCPVIYSFYITIFCLINLINQAIVLGGNAIVCI